MTLDHHKRRAAKAGNVKRGRAVGNHLSDPTVRIEQLRHAFRIARQHTTLITDAAGNAPEIAAAIGDLRRRRHDRAGGFDRISVVPDA